MHHNQIQIRGKIYYFHRPWIMGIINVTPDSFYAGSRFAHGSTLLNTVEKMLEEGADIIDVGGMSTRPYAQEVDLETELQRLLPAVKEIRQHFPQAILSIDTWRAEVVRILAEEGIDLVNDISGGCFDSHMFPVVSHYQLAYILMHTLNKPEVMQDHPKYDNIIDDLFRYFSKQIRTAQSMGVHNIILDPGFGFGKNAEHNYSLLRHLSEFSSFGLPVLVGLSRKSMIFQTIGTHAEDALAGTLAAESFALLNKANIVRVHDVIECRQIIDIALAYTSLT